MNILVTVKNEYMIRIKNLLTKLIFDRFKMDGK